MTIAFDPEEYIAALGDLTPLVNQPGGYQGTIDILNQFAGNKGSGSYNIPNGGFTMPTTVSPFSSGLNYAQSIAGGQNVPNMIAPGISYSAEQPGGYTQADLNGTPPPPPPVYKEPDDPSFFGTGIGGVTIPGGRRDKMPPLRNIFGNQGGGIGDFVPPPGYKEGKIGNNPPRDPAAGLVRKAIRQDLLPPQVPPPGFKEPVDSNDSERFNPIPGLTPIRQDLLPPIQVPPQEFDIEQILQDVVDSGIDIPNIRGPVDMPIPMDIPESLMIPKIPDELFIDDSPILDDILRTDYKVPQVPLNNLLNQNPPQTPVGMSPQETAKVSSQQDLLNLLSNKNELSQIPADDGVRNQYQVELNDFINKSPINMDTYKEELPVGSAINLGIPAFMESVVPMAVPGLGLAKNISDSFQNDFSPRPSPSFDPSPVPSFNRGIDYSNIYKFGR